MTLAVSSSASEVQAIVLRLVDQIRVECDAIRNHSARGGVLRDISKRLEGYARTAEDETAKAMLHEPILAMGDNQHEQGSQ